MLLQNLTPTKFRPGLFLSGKMHLLIFMITPNFSLGLHTNQPITNYENKTITHGHFGL